MRQIVLIVQLMFSSLTSQHEPLIFSSLTSQHDGFAQIPIVDDEMKKAAGDEKDEDIQMTQGIVQKLVTADGTYASQSAFSALLPMKKDQVRWVVFVFAFSLIAYY